MFSTVEPRFVPSIWPQENILGQTEEDTTHNSNANLPATAINPYELPEEFNYNVDTYSHFGIVSNVEKTPAVSDKEREYFQEAMSDIRGTDTNLGNLTAFATTSIDFNVEMSLLNLGILK